METQKLHEQKAPKKAQSQQPRQSLSVGIPRQSLGTSNYQDLYLCDRLTAANFGFIP
mgnify:CR=1 FL=1